MTGALFSAGEAASILFGCFFVLLILRVPVAFALGLACLPLFYLEPRLGTMMLAQETFNAYNSFILLAVPFFLLTANLMSVGGIEFTSFAWYRTSELADLPLWMIHIAWPVAAVTWIVFLGEQFYDETRILFGRSAT